MLSAHNDNLTKGNIKKFPFAYELKIDIFGQVREKNFCSCFPQYTFLPHVDDKSSFLPHVDQSSSSMQIIVLQYHYEKQQCHSMLFNHLVASFCSIMLLTAPPELVPLPDNQALPAESLIEPSQSKRVCLKWITISETVQRGHWVNVDSFFLPWPEQLDGHHACQSSVV